MAYPVLPAITSLNNSQSTTHAAVLPPHEIGDIMFVCASQDGGTVAITMPAGWNNVGGQVASGSSRTVVFEKRMTTTSEPNPTLTGRNETWVVTAFVVRDAPASSYIDVSARNDWSGTNSPTSPTVTTGTDDCLLLHVIGSDGNRRIVPDSGEINYIAKDRTTSGGGNSLEVGYRQAGAAGATGAITWLHETGTEGGSAFTIAIKNSAGGSRARFANDTFEFAERFGSRTAIVTTDASLVISAINGISTQSSTPSKATNTTIVDSPWMSASAATFNDAASDAFVGVLSAITTTDFENKNASITFTVSDVSVNRFAEEGIVVALIDSTGNWAAWQASPRAAMVNGSAYTLHWTPDTSPTYGASGSAVDLADINRFAIFQHRPSSTSNLSLAYRDLIAKDVTVLVGGGVDNPVSPAMFQNATAGWGYFLQASNQGSGQGEVTNGIQIGDGGVTETYADFTATSFETSLPGIRNQLADYSMPLTIYPGDNDTMIFASCVIKANTIQELRYHADSSLLSNDTWKGASIVGPDVFGLAGKTFDGAIFTDCTVDQNGGGFESTFINSPLEASDMGLITNSTFDADSEVDLTVAGTFTVDGNTIDSVSNSSAGNIILNMSNGSTIANNLSPGTITINSGVPVTVENCVIGKPVYVFANVTGTVIIDEIALTSVVSTTYPYTGDESITIRHRDSSSPGTQKKRYTNTDTIRNTGVTHTINFTDDSLAN